MPKIIVDLSKELDIELQKAQLQRTIETNEKPNKAILAAELIQKGLQALQDEQERAKKEQENLKKGN